MHACLTADTRVILCMKNHEFQHSSFQLYSFTSCISTAENLFELNQSLRNAGPWVWIWVRQSVTWTKERKRERDIFQKSLTAPSAFQLTSVVLGWNQKPAFVYFCVKPKSHFLKDHCRFCNLHCYLWKLHVLCQNRADGCNSVQQNQNKRKREK